MKIKQLFFNLFKKLSCLVSGKGLAKLPFATKIYQFIYKKLKPNGIIEIITAENHKMFVDSRDTGMAPYFIMHGDFIPDESEVLKKILKPGMIFIDVGANIGYFSLIAAKLVGGQSNGKGMVFAFEPDENNFSLLQKNINANGYKNIIAIKKAVSDKVSTAKFYLEKENLCAHSLTPKTNCDFTEVETISLDEYFKDKKIDPVRGPSLKTTTLVKQKDFASNGVDVVKIDVEGMEPAVLRGMENLIKANESMAIITEYYPKAISNAGYSPNDYLESLKKSGFRLVNFGNQNGKLVNILCLKNFEY